MAGTVLTSRNFKALRLGHPRSLNAGARSCERTHLIGGNCAGPDEQMEYFWYKATAGYWFWGRSHPPNVGAQWLKQAKSSSNAPAHLSSCCWTFPAILTQRCCLLHMGGSVSWAIKPHFVLLGYRCLSLPSIDYRGAWRGVLVPKSLGAVKRWCC